LPSQCSITQVVSSAVDSVKKFAKISNIFFNFEKRNGYLGWENWLTVEIFRKLNSSCVVPYAKYSCGKGNKSNYMDLKVGGSASMAIEIKTNYLDQKEVNEMKGELSFPERINKDISKVKIEKSVAYRLILIAIVFDTLETRKKFESILKGNEDVYIKRMNWNYYNCSVRGRGQIILLVISNSQRLPNI